MSETNLSKTKPALRTKGAVTGNFGAGRRKAGSQLNDIPANKRESLGNFPTQDEYYLRMVQAYNMADNERVKAFCLEEIRKIEAQKPGIRMVEPSGAYCDINSHFVGSHQ